MTLSRSNHLLRLDSGPAVRRHPGDPVRVAPPSAPGAYALATGEAAAYRLRMLHRIYGPGSRRRATAPPARQCPSARPWAKTLSSAPQRTLP
jgi:hypothetical protein